jgi:hypothetical protein
VTALLIIQLPLCFQSFNNYWFHTLTFEQVTAILNYIITSLFSKFQQLLVPQVDFRTGHSHSKFPDVNIRTGYSYSKLYNVHNWVFKVLRTIG